METDAEGRRFREHVDWSDWKRIMAPGTENSKLYTKRGLRQEGRYNRGHLEDLRGKGCCIYEWCAVKRKTKHVVYIGSTCMDKCQTCCSNPNGGQCTCQDCSLHTRIQEYVKNGSHISDLINDALTRRFNLEVRYIQCKSIREARRLEDAYLSMYNYAWNKINNLSRREEFLRQVP